MDVETARLVAGTRADATTGAGAWLVALRRYILFIALANLVWEVAQLPLYTIWRDGTPGEIAFAVLHCTAGDVLIAGASLVAALLLAGHGCWPGERYLAVAAATLFLGLGYTLFSEWHNTAVRGSWAYTELMPTLPVIGAGLSPLAQWTVIPLAAFWWARRTSVSRVPTRGHV